MGCIHKIGNTYYIEFEARGLKYQQKAGENKQQARELLTSIEEKIRLGEMSAIVHETPVAFFLNDVPRFIKKNYSARTASRMRDVLTHFGKFLVSRNTQIKSMSQITPRVIEDYKHFLLHDKLKPWKINFSLLLMREIFEYAIKTGALNDNPTLHIHLVVDPRKRWMRTSKFILPQPAVYQCQSLFELAAMLEVTDILRVMPFYQYLRNPLDGSELD